MRKWTPVTGRSLDRGSIITGFTVHTCHQFILIYLSYNYVCVMYGIFCSCFVLNKKELAKLHFTDVQSPVMAVRGRAEVVDALDELASFFLY